MVMVNIKMNLFEKVAMLKAFEADIAEEFNSGNIRAPIHLSGGNEGDVIEQFLPVDINQDWCCSTWRSHYHAILMGVPLPSLKADILAGKSITLCYPDFRFVSSAIVGGIIPIALGLAWAIKRSGGTNKVHCFIGDMAARTGIKWECHNYAEGHELPLRFIIEDNGKSVCSDTGKTWGDTPGKYIKSVVANKYKYDLTWPHAGAGKRVQF